MRLDSSPFSSTAILLFAQSNKVAATSKPIVFHKKKNDLLWQKMNERILIKIQKTKLPFFISNEKNQIAGSFGQKLSDAIQTVFNQGFDRVIVVGNDSPSITPQHFKEACLGFLDKEVVLGPDLNGGSYLIGVSRNTFDKEQFQKLSWQTNQVFEQLKTLSQGSVKIIAPLADFNALADLKKLLRELSFLSVFKNFLLSLLWKKRDTNPYTDRLYRFSYFSTNFNKGPPFFGLT